MVIVEYGKSVEFCTNLPLIYKRKVQSSTFSTGNPLIQMQ